MKIILLLVAVAAAACSSNEYREGPLGIRYKPPPYAKLISESKDGDVAVASFSGGIDIRRVPQPALPIAGDDQLLQKVLAASRMSAPSQMRSAKDGTLPFGPVMRWDLEQGDDRALIYYLPAKDHYLLIQFSASKAQFDKRSDKFELSLSSVKPQ
jgi:hypothetical protein